MSINTFKITIMKIQMSLNESFCELAIQCALFYGDEITSKAKYIRAIKEYLIMYGNSSADDHCTEHSSCREQAKIINSKYFTS